MLVRRSCGYQLAALLELVSPAFSVQVAAFNESMMPGSSLSLLRFRLDRQGFVDASMQTSLNSAT